jgi:hypothetical protein
MSQQLQTRVVRERSASGDHDWLLFRGIRSMLRCDEAEVVHGIANYVVSQHRSLRLLSVLIERTRETPFPGAIALIGWLRSLLSVPRGERSDGAVWIARLGNERRAIETIRPLVPELSWTELKFRSRPDAIALSALAMSLRGYALRPTPAGLPVRETRVRATTSVRRILIIARLLHRRYKFFKVLRVVELIGYYTRYLDIFQDGRFSLAVMSSHSNPHGIAFNLAARKCGLPVVLITHGMPVRPVAKLCYDLAVVHCEAARQTYLEEGCQMDRVLVHGRRQNYAPMPAGPLPERLRIGMFLCKDVNEKRLREVIEGLLCDPRVSRIVVRPHPKNLWLGIDAWIASRNDVRICRTFSSSVFRDVEASDIVLAGNSSVLIDAVTAGRPSGYVPGLDHGSPDLHAFVARGLIYPIENKLGEFSLDPEAMLRFYQRRDWSNVLPLFANVEEDEASVAARVGAAMRELAVSHGAPVGARRVKHTTLEARSQDCVTREKAARAITGRKVY